MCHIVAVICTEHKPFQIIVFRNDIAHAHASCSQHILDALAEEYTERFRHLLIHLLMASGNLELSTILIPIHFSIQVFSKHG